jgi:acetate kinase
MIYCEIDHNHLRIYKGNARHYRLTKKDLSKGFRPEDILSIAKAKPIPKIVYRVRYGGSFISEKIQPVDSHVLKVISQIKRFKDPDDLAMIDIIHRMCRHAPDLAHILLCESAVYFNLPRVSRQYALPPSLTDDHTRKFGNNGIAHQWAFNALSKTKHYQPQKVVTVCLNAPANAAAFEKGKIMDTSDGFGPIGEILSERACGFIDLSIIFEMRQDGYTLDQIEDILLQQSGIRSFRQNRKPPTRSARSYQKPPLLKKMYLHQIRKSIGSMIAMLGGVDIIVFIGNDSQTSLRTAKNISRKLLNLGVQPHNPVKKKTLTKLTKQTSPVQVYFTPHKRFPVVAQYLKMNHPHVT